MSKIIIKLDIKDSKLKNKLDEVLYGTGLLELPSFKFFESKQDMRRSKLDELLSMSRIDDVNPIDSRMILKFIGKSRIEKFPIFEIDSEKFNKDETVHQYISSIFGHDVEINLVTQI